MNSYWNGQRRERDYRLDPWAHNQNRYENQQQFNNYFSGTPNLSHFSQDYPRSRISHHAVSPHSGEKSFNSTYRNFRNRNWGRRSASAPRTVVAEDKVRWNPKPNSANSRTRNTSLLNDNNGKPYCEDRFKNSHMNRESPQVPQLKKFRTIFDPESTSISNPGSQTVKNSDALKAVKSNAINDQIGHIVTSIDLKKEPSDLTDKNYCNLNINSTGVESQVKVRKVYLKSLQKNEEKNDLTSYYGESLTELNKKDLKVHNTNLPIVDWPKKLYNIDNIPDYDSRVCVGGEGVTLEVFYLCKYCKMFTGGCQIDSHLKSSYHYDRYKEFLRTGQTAGESNSSSSECESKTSKSSKKEAEKESTRQIAMEIDDASEIVYSCHQELDFD